MDNWLVCIAGWFLHWILMRRWFSDSIMAGWLIERLKDAFLINE
jgi:hypothetical protein